MDIHGGTLAFVALLTILCVSPAAGTEHTDPPPIAAGTERVDPPPVALAAGVECTNPPPGVRKMVRGVDITELDLVPLQISGSDGFKNLVVNFTCGQGRTWTRDGVEYQLPDQAWHMTTSPAGWFTADVAIYKTSGDVRRNLNWQVGVEGSIWRFSFSVSHSYTKMQHTITNTSRYISEASSFDSASRVDLIPDWSLNLDRFAQDYISRFIGNKTYTTDPEVYQRFIDYFGTHYFSSARFGGYIRVVHETSRRYYASHTDEQAQTDAHASYLSVISAHGGIGTGSTSVRSQFSYLSRKTVKYYGGTTNLLSDGGLQAWQPTVDHDPWLFSGKLKPISKLIPDHAQRSSMQAAVLQHVLRRYLREIRRTLETLADKVGDSSNTVTSLEARLSEMEGLAQGQLVEAGVGALSRDVEAQLAAAPDWWFVRHTRLCFKWRPSGDGSGQCGGVADRLLCAATGSVTDSYFDDTDERDGGCFMQWSIQSSHFDPWFSHVKLCFRWYPDGDHPTQCGKGADRLLCAPVNRYTSEYQDDTDNGDGGCRMSWRLVVPGSSPQWMKTVQLCFHWYPVQEENRCGGEGLSRDLCVTANSWTPYYRDDTHGDSWGCRMRWGIKFGV